MEVTETETATTATATASAVEADQRRGLKVIKLDPRKYSPSVRVLLGRANAFSAALCVFPGEKNEDLVSTPGFRSFFEFHLGIFPEAVGAGAALVRRAARADPSSPPTVFLEDGTRLPGPRPPPRHPPQSSDSDSGDSGGDAENPEDADARALEACLWTVAAETARKMITRSAEHLWHERVEVLTGPALRRAGRRTRVDVLATELALLRRAGWRVLSSS